MTKKNKNIMPVKASSMPKFINDVKGLVAKGLNSAYQAVNSSMLSTYWNIGKRIVDEEQKGLDRAEYGKALIDELSKALVLEFGTGYSPRYLRAFRQFYLTVPTFEIWKSRFPNLTWTHVFRALRVGDQTAVRWYLENASTQMWSVRTLSRNIESQYYERHFVAPKLTLAKEIEGFGNTAPELIKSPIIAEFLGLAPDKKYSESKLESAIIDHLQNFIMELGKGFAFVKRQQLVRTGAEDYFIDLVFYNVILKCYVLIDLKTKRVTHQDVGQMDMYIRMYDELIRTEGDNPTIGIVLCEETDEDIARYSVLHDNDHLFASKYMTYMPTPEQLQTEIERQKAIYMLTEACGKETDK